MSDTIASTDATRTTADRYFAAWADRDAAAIAALHAPDSRFEVHGVEGPALGVDAMRAAAEGFFARYPGFAFEAERVLVGDGHWVLDRTLHSEATPGGVALLDVVELDDEGRVLRKDTFLRAVAS